MKHTKTLGAIIASALLLTSAASLAQGARDRDPGPQDRAQTERGQMDRDRDLDRDIDRDFDRDRLRDREDEPSHDRDRDQDRTHAPDSAQLSDQDIYGSEVMSVEERNQYREQLRVMDSDNERLQFKAQHREKMQLRAKSQGVPLKNMKETEEAE